MLSLCDTNEFFPSRLGAKQKAASLLSSSPESDCVMKYGRKKATLEKGARATQAEAESSGTVVHYREDTRLRVYYKGDILIHKIVIDTVMISIKEGMILEAGRPVLNSSSPSAGATLGSCVLSITATWLRCFVHARCSVLRAGLGGGPWCEAHASCVTLVKVFTPSPGLSLLILKDGI